MFACVAKHANNTSTLNVVQITNQMDSLADEIFIVSVDTEGHNFYQTKKSFKEKIYQKISTS